MNQNQLRMEWQGCNETKHIGLPISTVRTNKVSMESVLVQCQGHSLMSPNVLNRQQTQLLDEQ